MPLLTQFRKWAEANGLKSRLVPKESRGKGIGLFLRSAEDSSQDHTPAQPTVNGDSGHRGELAFIPASLILSRSRILKLDRDCLQTTFKAIGLADVSERLALVLFILYERLLLEQKHCALASSASASATASTTTAHSPDGFSFADYVAVLPDVRTPVTLDPDTARGYLAGTLLLDSVCAKRKKLESEFERLSGNMGVFEHWPVHPTLDHFVWADATFWSRVLSFGSQWGKDTSALQQGLDSDQTEYAEDALDVNDDLHMVPFLDFANHAAKPNIRWQVDPDGLRVWGLKSLMDPTPLNEQDPGNTDREVFLSYGNKPNTELLFLYGFTLQDNPTQFLTLALPLDEDDPFYLPKVHTLMRLGIPPRVTIYMNRNDGPEDLVELCQGLWVTPDSQILLWIYALNEEDGLGAMIEEPAVKLCVPHESVETGDDGDDGDDDDQNANIEEVDLIDEETVGRLIMTVQGLKIATKVAVKTAVPKLQIYPVVVLRSLVLLAERIEYYISRIMETGDKVQRVEGIEIMRSINYEGDSHHNDEEAPSTPVRSRTPSITRIGRNTGDCLLPTLLEPDHEHPVTTRQLEIETQIAGLVATMKNYRIEEMNLLVQIGNLLGEAQTHCFEVSPFIQEYLASMQIQE
ncbi:hypothetical protein BGZ70_000662 [Mortierella alpina]|uniref:SET domain-containing protein n=1 Tax=Mortierella alpina TaxID=64518 RepID=A0A9P6LXR2_MORAP|nr:hypothetical protein BGZ70_000662 [Mortierella alpina]